MINEAANHAAAAGNTKKETHYSFSTDASIKRNIPVVAQENPVSFLYNLIK
jgi:hypothetical protein